MRVRGFWKKEEPGGCILIYQHTPVQHHGNIEGVSGFFSVTVANITIYCQFYKKRVKIRRISVLIGYVYEGRVVAGVPGQ